MVQRTAGATPEVLATISTPAWDLDVRHGGSRIDFKTASGPGMIVRGSASWTVATPTSTALVPGGSWQSSNGRSHDGRDTATVEIHVDQFQSPDSLALFVYLSDSTSSHSLLHLQPLSPGLHLSWSSMTCYYRLLSWTPNPCDFGLPLPDTSEHAKRQRVAFSPKGDLIFAAHNRQITTLLNVVNWYPADSFGNEEAIVRFRQLPVRTKVYGVTRTGTAQPIFDSAGVNVSWMSVSEDGKELAVAVGRDSVEWQTFPGYWSESTYPYGDEYMPPGADWEGRPHTRIVTACKILFFQTTNPYAQTRSAVSSPDACADSVTATGTFSPNRVPRTTKPMPVSTGAASAAMPTSAVFPSMVKAKMSATEFSARFHAAKVNGKHGKYLNLP